MERLGSMPRPFEQWPSRFMAKILPKRKKWRLIVFTRALHAADHAWLLMLLHGAFYMFYEFENLKAVNLFFPGLASSSSSSCRPCVPFPVVPGQRLIFDVNQSLETSSGSRQVSPSSCCPQVSLRTVKLLAWRQLRKLVGAEGTWTLVSL